MTVSYIWRRERAALGAFAAVLGLACGDVVAADSAYKLFPVPAVFATANDSAASKIDADFSVGVPAAAGGKFFDEKFRATFPETVARIDNANKRRTFAVSLQIARASKYQVDKPDGTSDVYLPITGSIYFTNLLTGEVLYTVTRTEIKQATLRRDTVAAGSPRIQTLFRENFEETVASLITTARTQFRPSTLSVTVRGDWKGLAILDGGREQGISRGDALTDAQGNELQVLSAGPAYAIAKPELGTFQAGTVFSKVSNQTLAEIRKPRVLPLIDRAPPDFSEQTLVQLLSDTLGAKSPISLVPVNTTYQAVLTTVAAKADIRGCSQ